MRIVYDLDDAFKVIITVAPYMDHRKECDFYATTVCNCGFTKLFKETKEFANALADQIAGL